MAGQRTEGNARSPIRPRVRESTSISSMSSREKNPRTQASVEPIEEQRPADGRPGSSSDDVPERVLEGDDVEGIRVPVTLKAPHRVTKEEREAHEVTHMPYRAWCPHCVQARGRNTPHRPRADDAKASGVPKIAMDYVFMSVADERASSNPVLVMVDEATGEICQSCGA